MASEDFTGNAGWADDNNRIRNGKVRAFFHTVQTLMKKKSEDAQRPIYEERIFITKITPGDKGQVIDRRIRMDEKTNDIEDYPEEWARFQQKKANQVVGFPIENWPALNDTQKAEYKGANIRTVEEFANLSDQVVQNLPMGTMALRDKARAYIVSGKDAEIIGKIKAEAEERESALQRQIDELKALIEARTAPEKVPV